MNQYTIATVVKIYPHPWFDRMKKGLEKFSAETGHKTFLVGPPKIDENLEEQTLKEVIARKVDAICIVVYFPQAIEMTLSSARQHGTKIISHEAPTMRNNDYDIEAFGNADYGVRLMDYLARYMEREGEYAVLFESSLTKSHAEWAISAITHQQQKYPRMQLSIGKIEHHEDQTLAYTKMQTLIRTYPKLKGVLALGGAGMVGAAKAVEEAGLQGKIKLVGNCLVSMGGPWLKKGVVELISFWDPADIGYVMNKLAVMALQGQKAINGIDLGVPGYHQIRLDGKVLYGSAWIDVTKDNMASYNF